MNSRKLIKQVGDTVGEQKIGKYVICNKGYLVKNYNEKVLQKYMKNKKIEISVELGLGKYSKRIWASDLTKRYVEINSDYRT